MTKISFLNKVLCLFAISCCLSAHSQILRKRTTLLMGGRFDISIVAKDSLTAEQNINEVIAEITRIENLISDWKPDSQVSQVNQNAGIKPIKVDREVFELTQRAIKLSGITNGSFDVSFAAMDRIWKFDESMTEMPSAEAIKKSVEKVGYKNIILDSVESTIFLKLKGMKIGFGALGEGYATDKCRAMMIAKGIQAGIINGSGDMSTWGKQPNGQPWKIGITNPFKPEKVLAVVPLNQGAVTTSGSYEKFVVFNGKRYSHIINPATGYPATGLCSVTVFGPNAETANGLSTSLMVLGQKEGLLLLQKFSEYSCVMINDNGKVIKSKNFAYKL
ncbi:FAD:protein FMN transferase [Flavobacterium sp. WLB]|uniref:FAD:protein FMN transferase n=1 Tax=unclassified Flavobacterium TaxID=196869 RepID=UPI0006ABA3BE|nr:MULTISPECIES: FAD:protein FMN transferase [unclassified Flavobacterium]KOP38203.1 thiamine biosynthesis protein ApbE [Flavobacterium sp. VMW]OWU92300.1 thiamine biosynthesis protein ApbE [Flavobacterium sp. NLM]PUU70800.1 FAD:protein FMN transferase [Flavobacterium sp. WLB]